MEHTEVITIIAIIVMPILMIGLMMLMASGKTPEANELEGFPDGKE